MDASELRTLEEKARAIVATLATLESETERQRRMGDQLEQGKEALLALASALSSTSDRLADTIDLLQHSTLAEDIDRLNSKIDDVGCLANLARDDARKAEDLCKTSVELVTRAEDSAQRVVERLDGIESTCAELLRSLESLREESAQRDAELKKRFDIMEEVIGRIDRNTQKGFGKERAKHAAW